MSFDLRDRIAEVIFEQCRDEGIDDTLSEDDLWGTIEKPTREMYEDVATAVLDCMEMDEIAEDRAAKEAAHKKKSTPNGRSSGRLGRRSMNCPRWRSCHDESADVFVLTLSLCMIFLFCAD
jgi:hypothetical protein